jgi:hypothetical protein
MGLAASTKSEIGTEQNTSSFVPDPQHVIQLPAIPPDKGLFISLAKREGVVLAHTPTEFTARLTNILDGVEDADADLEAVFSLDEVSPSDRDLVKDGAIFYWNIGYYDDPSGQRHRVSEIRFRRLPAWLPGELRNAARAAADIRRRLGII